MKPFVCSSCKRGFTLYKNALRHTEETGCTSKVGVTIVESGVIASQRQKNDTAISTRIALTKMTTSSLVSMARSLIVQHLPRAIALSMYRSRSCIQTTTCSCCLLAKVCTDENDDSDNITNDITTNINSDDRDDYDDDNEQQTDEDEEMFVSNALVSVFVFVL